MRKGLIVASLVMCSVLSSSPAFACYMVDGPGAGVETRQFPALPTVTATPSPIVTNVVHKSQPDPQPPATHWTAPVISHGSYGSPQAIAAQLVKPSELGCFDAVINRESGWDVHATNPSSGAYGLPQALPGSKMASEGADWQNNPATQLRWALKYMDGRYGSPCGAWNHEVNYGWY